VSARVVVNPSSSEGNQGRKNARGEGSASETRQKERERERERVTTLNAGLNSGGERKRELGVSEGEREEVKG
jgi:hypothetical protein